MRKQTIINLIVVLAALSPAGYLAYSWNSIPASFVTTFELTTSFQKIQTRNELAIAVVSLSVVSVLLYLLLRNLKRVDPKVSDATPVSAFNKLSFAITVFLLAFNYFFILSAKNTWVISSNLIFALLGLLIAIIGNYMNTLKPNYIAGIRLPWTLNDENNWRKTHQLAGKLWFAGGLLMCVISLLLDKVLLMPFMILLFVVIVIIPGIYSYRIYRKNPH